MEDNQHRANRLGVFYCRNTKEKIYEYVFRLLDEMKPYFDRLVIVAGDKLSSGARGDLKKYSEDIIADERLSKECTGFYAASVWMERTNAPHYDEIIFFDDHLVGPIYDLQPMFRKMDSIEADYWTIVSGKGGNETLSRHFICIRKPVMENMELKLMWSGAVRNPEGYLIAQGFWGASYIKAHEIEKLNPDSSLFYAPELIENYACPFFVMDIFTSDYSKFISESTGQTAVEMMKYLRRSGRYDTGLLYDFLIRTQHQSDLGRILHLNYTLPQDVCTWEDCSEILAKRKIAMLIHIFRTDMAEELAQYASYMPKGTDVYVTTDTDGKAAEIRRVFGMKGIERLKVLQVENRGRDVSSKLVAMKDHILSYDYVCCIHDKKTPHLRPQSVGESFGYKCFRNIAPSAEYVLNVIRLFEDHPKLGIAVPPEPNHGGFFTTLGMEWVGNFETTQKLAADLGLNVPMDEEKEPVAPFGSFFWFRPASMKKLYEKDWKYTDFPKEPIGDDATILHAVERIYPFVAQDAGYFPAVIMSDWFARMEYNNLKYYLRGYNRCLIDNGKVLPYQEDLEYLNKCISSFEKTPADFEKNDKLQLVRSGKKNGAPRAMRTSDQARIEALTSELEGIKQSVTWRMTKPVRDLLDLISGKK